MRTPARIYGPAQIATGPATIYTVPASTKAVVRKIHLQNPSGSPVTVTLSIGADAAATRILDAFSLPAAAAGVTGNVYTLWGPFTLAAAEVIQAAAGTNNIVTVTIDADVYTVG